MWSCFGSSTAVRDVEAARPSYQTNFTVKGSVSAPTLPSLMTERCRCDPAAAALLIALFGSRTIAESEPQSSRSCRCNERTKEEAVEPPAAAMRSPSYDLLSDPPPENWLRVTVSKQPSGTAVAAAKAEDSTEVVEADGYRITIGVKAPQQTDSLPPSPQESEHFRRLVLHPLQCEGIIQPYFIDELCVPSIRQLLTASDRRPLAEEQLQHHKLSASDLLLPEVFIPAVIALHASDTNEFDVMEIHKAIVAAHVTLFRGAESQDLRGDVFYPHNSMKSPLRMTESEGDSLADSLKCALLAAKVPADAIKLEGYFLDTEVSRGDEFCVMPSAPFVVTDLLSLNGVDVRHYAAEERRKLLGYSLCEVGERVLIARTVPLTSAAVDSARNQQRTKLILKDRQSQFPTHNLWGSALRRVGVLELPGKVGKEGEVATTEPKLNQDSHDTSSDSSTTKHFCLAICGVDLKISSTAAIFNNEVTLRTQEGKKWKPTVRGFVDEHVTKKIRNLLQDVATSGAEEAAVVAQVAITLPARKTASMFTGVLFPDSVRLVHHQRDVTTNDELCKALRWGKHASEGATEEDVPISRPALHDRRLKQPFSDFGASPQLFRTRWEKVKNLLGQGDPIADATWIEIGPAPNPQQSITLSSQSMPSSLDRGQCRQALILQRTNGTQSWLFPPWRFFGRRLSAVVLSAARSSDPESPQPVQFDVWVKPPKSNCWLRADVGPGPDSSAERLFFSPLEGEDTHGTKNRHGTFSTFCDALQNLSSLEPAFHAAMSTEEMRQYAEAKANRPNDLRHDFWRSLVHFLSDAVLYVYEADEPAGETDRIPSDEGSIPAETLAENWRRALENNREPAEIALANVVMT